MIALVRVLVVEHRDVLERRYKPAPHRDQKRVVRQFPAVIRVHLLCLEIDPVGPSLAPFRARPLRDRTQWIAPHASLREWLVDRQRPVAQLVVGGQQRDVECVARKRPQPQQPFDGGDSPSADDDPEAVHRPSL